MKKFTVNLLIASSILLLSGCGMNSALMLNHNQNSTQIQLSSNNYKVVEHISGTAEVEYILMIGGLDKRQLYENAYSDMIKKAGLLNTSRALVNIITEEHVGGVPPFYYKRTITVSAHVIEFTR